MRALGVPSSRYKIVQEAMKSLLEAVHEPIFCESSHGLIPYRGCHSALKQTSTWNGFSWCNEEYIKGFFDNVDHKIVETLLLRRIQDQQFILEISKSRLCGKLSVLRISLGCFPILFSILSNIYLHELDLCVKDWIKANSVEPIIGIDWYIITQRILYSLNS